LSAIKRLVFGDNPRRTAVRVLVLATVSVVTLRWLLIPIHTEGSSMLPTYAPDRLNFVNRLAYIARQPTRGEVVAIQMAGPHVLYVKRVIGLPGERVAVRDGTVLINGTPLVEPYVKHRRPWDVQEVTLGPREYFLIGDNRGMSAGEHDFGRADIDRILGKVVF
jgi:signal peptidase I